MKISSWYTKLRAKTQNASRGTRVPRLLLKRALLHLRINIRGIGRFRLLRSLRLVPLRFEGLLKAAAGTALRHRLRQNASWLVVTVAGAVGLSLMLYLQLFSQPFSTAGGGDSRVDAPSASRHLPSPILELDVMSTSPATPNEPPEEQFVVTSQPPAAFPGPAFGVLNNTDAGDGWTRFQPLSRQLSSLLERNRTHLELPDLIVPAGNADETLAAQDVEPGPRELDILVSREMPASSAIRQPMDYRIVVSNQGHMPVDRITVEEQIPAGHRVVETSPPGTLRQGTLPWHLRNLKPRQKRQLQVRIVPSVAGPTTSLASIRPVVAVASQTEVTQPRLQLDVSAPEFVSAGERCVVQFKVTNTSAKAMDGVILRVVLPENLTHPKGRSLDYAMDSLAAGESHTAWLTTHAVTVGTGAMMASLVVDGAERRKAVANVAIRKSAVSPRRRRPTVRHSLRPCDCLR